MIVNGPGQPFEMLFTQDVAAEPSLPEPFRKVMDGDWHIPRLAGKPYVFTNFAASRDGRVSYNDPGVSTGGHVTGFNGHDRWLMGLLRARADAVLMGDATVKVEVGHLWTAEYICDRDAPAFAELRRSEGRAPLPLMAIVSQDCDLNPNENCFQQDGAHIILATTDAGIERAKAMKTRARLDVLHLGAEWVDMARLVEILHRDYGAHDILCEGGPRVMGGLLAAGLVTEEFLTYCPSILGERRDKFRPSYIEGVAFDYGSAPQSHIHSLRRAGDYLFLQTRVEYP